MRKKKQKFVIPSNSPRTQLLNKLINSNDILLNYNTILPDMKKLMDKIDAGTAYVDKLNYQRFYDIGLRLSLLLNELKGRGYAITPEKALNGFPVDKISRNI